jgi:hypothetical protein
VEAIPNLGSHQLFHEEQDESQEAMREEAILQDAGVSHRSPSRERPPLKSSNATNSEFDSQMNSVGGDEGDFSVTFVILEDNDVLAEAAPPPPSAPEERAREEDEEEEEEAEEPQQFKLFENQQGKKLRRKGDKEAEG